jgi:hypothetical protein
MRLPRAEPRRRRHPARNRERLLRGRAGGQVATDTACTWPVRGVSTASSRHPRSRWSRRARSATASIGAPTAARGGPAIASPAAATRARHLRRAPRGRRSRRASRTGERWPRLVCGDNDAPPWPSHSGSRRRLPCWLGSGSTPATLSSAAPPANLWRTRTCVSHFGSSATTERVHRAGGDFVHSAH